MTLAHSDDEIPTPPGTVYADRLARRYLQSLVLLKS